MFNCWNWFITNWSRTLVRVSVVLRRSVQLRWNCHLKQSFSRRHSPGRSCFSWLWYDSCRGSNHSNWSCWRCFVCLYWLTFKMDTIPCVCFLCANFREIYSNTNTGTTTQQVQYSVKIGVSQTESTTHTITSTVSLEIGGAFKAFSASASSSIENSWQASNLFFSWRNYWLYLSLRKTIHPICSLLAVILTTQNQHPVSKLMQM